MLRTALTDVAERLRVLCVLFVTAQQHRMFEFSFILRSGLPFLEGLLWITFI